MKSIQWKVPEGKKVFVVPVPCEADTVVSDLDNWQYTDEKKPEQINVIDPDDFMKSETFNILGWVHKVPINEVSGFVARQCLDKGTINGELITGKTFARLIKTHRPEFSNANFIVFYELERISNDTSKTHEKEAN